MARLTMRDVRRSLRSVGVRIKHNTEWGEYIVRLDGSPADHGYHTSDLADAYQTGHAMAADAAKDREKAHALRKHYLNNGNPMLERAKREDEAMLGLPKGSIKA